MRRRLFRGRLPAVAAVFACATAAAAQQTPELYHAQDIEPYHARSLDTPAASGELDGVYALTSVSGQRLPVGTPSSYGVLRGGALAVRGDRYVLVYRYGSGEQLRIDVRLAYDRSGRIEFRPTTPGIPAASAHYADGQIVSVVDGGFGIRNARFVFTLQDGAGGGSATGPGAGPDPRREPSPEPDARREPSPDSRRQPEPETSPVAGCPASRPGNLVEPLSNGLLLSWDVDQIREQFGAGQSSWDARTITFSGFRVAVGGREEKIWHLHLTAPGACLNSGIAYGSTRDEVKRVFGAFYGTTYGQYKLTFSYDGDRLVDICIDPAAEEFTPYSRATGRIPAPAPVAPGRSTRPAPMPPPQPAAPAQASSILGKWWGVQSMTQIDVNADGTYTSPNGGRGSWRMTGDQIVFTGALAGWNNGHAQLTKGGWIEFLWKDASGAAYLFQLVRR